MVPADYSIPHVKNKCLWKDVYICGIMDICSIKFQKILGEGKGLEDTYGIMEIGSIQV
jgi:hypothetical protein